MLAEGGKYLNLCLTSEITTNHCFKLFQAVNKFRKLLRNMKLLNFKQNYINQITINFHHPFIFPNLFSILQAKLLRCNFLSELGKGFR